MGANPRLRSLAALAASLTVLPFVNANAHGSHEGRTFRHRRQFNPPTLPAGWSDEGCYYDNPGARTLLGGGYASGTEMTPLACANYCASHNFIYAGTEYSGECYCDNYLQNGGGPAPSGDCNMPCSGNANEVCGAGGRLNLYWSGQEPPPPPQINPGVGDWVSIGCWSDNVNGQKTLPVGMGVAGGPSQNDIAACTTACFNAGYGFAGAQYAAECYCGTTLGGSGTLVPDGDCNMLCSGDNTEYCGGPNRLNVYNYTGTELPPINPGGGGGGGGGGGNVSPVTEGLPAGWRYDGCWIDNAHGRIFEHGQGADEELTVVGCIETCSGLGYSVAGMQFSTECWCGDRLIAGAEEGLEGDCNMGCGGANTEACGGPNRLSVYTSEETITVLPVPQPKTTDLPGEWVYQGCLREPTTVKMWINQIIWPTNNTAENCLTQCATFGYPAAGMEYGEECYCGDITDVDLKDGVYGDESECNIPCSGDPTQICGGGSRLTAYYWNAPMNVWHTPENTGYYEFFAPGIVVPLIATVSINNKISFLEKWGTGFWNSTGAYEFDPTLAPNIDLAWREQNVQTDIFCAGSVILPDKAGRQLNVGGWSLDSTFGVRLYTPDGSPGVNGTNDWEENWHELKLQRGRWYPTAVTLANGSVLIMGGQIGSNDLPQPNLEILPKPEGGDTVLELPWLARTDPNNLYPFIFILPSENIFVGYYNEARILEPVNFQTIKELPNAPGAVNDFLAGRTYPLEGAAVLLPQHAPYTDPLEVLICGGSTIGAGFALDNCVTIAPEAEEPQWTIERMPSKRVLPCIVPLPDGTFMIMNGAHQGVAGFGLATDPNLSAILYDPYKPLGQRMSILADTTIARMYHSEAILLPDSRVLVSGSDPQTFEPDGTPIFPEEFRLEVYVPPYLNEGRTQPEYTMPNNDWAYGGQYQITVTLHHGDTSTMRVSLLGAVSSTHGNSMGARTMFPAFTCAGNVCTITAPPNAGVSPPGWHMLFVLDGPTPSHAQWVRIGGDPSDMGSWPNLPGFTPPGSG